MIQVSEKALQMYWLSMVRRGSHVALLDGRRAEVLSPGIWNKDAGPDFTNARLRLDARIWCGDIEMHIKASDWYQHGHQHDEAYRGVVLHVVACDDARIHLPSGEELPQMLIDLPEHFFEAVEMLTATGQPYLRCGIAKGFHATMSAFQIRDWLETLLSLRCRARADKVLALLEKLNGDWRQTAFAMLARALGFGINSDSMQTLAESIPLNTLERHSGSRFQLEALLFGKAGMLPGTDNMFDEYYQALAREFGFLGHKYAISPLYSSIWKMARTRPANFPYRRIAQLAAYCEGGFTLVGEMLDNVHDADALCGVFCREPSEYWLSHFSFVSERTAAVRHTSSASRRLLCINAAVPFIFAYGLHHRRDDLCRCAETILTSLAAEQSALIDRWKKLDIKCRSAADSQALTFLYKEYCSANRCSECRWGVLLLRYLSENPQIASEHYMQYRSCL